MAGTGGAYVLSKGFAVLSTYNTSAAAGVTAFRCVAVTSAGKIDLNATSTARSLGVVMENIDQTKVATDKAVANVALHGIVPVYVTTAGSIVLGDRVTASTNGGVIEAAATHIPLGIVVGITGTLGNGDIIQVLLTPGMPAAV